MVGQLRLVAGAADVCTQKILVAAKAAGVDLRLEAAKGAQLIPELRKGDKVVRYTNAILRYIGRMYENSEVYGNNFMESAQVDSWLDWGELELGSQKPPRLEQAIDVLEKHLDSRVFLVGQRFTLADASISCSLYNFQQQGQQLPRATKRWLGTCTAHQAFAAVVASSGSPVSKAAVAPTVATPSAAAAAEQPLVASYSKAVGGRTHIKRIVGAPDKGASLVGQKIGVCGWVKTAREADKGKLMFVQLNDGSTPLDIQVVIDCNAKGFDSLKGNIGTGASMKCLGQVVESPGGKQAVERTVVKDNDNKGRKCLFCPTQTCGFFQMYPMCHCGRSAGVAFKRDGSKYYRCGSRRDFCDFKRWTFP